MAIQGLGVMKFIDAVDLAFIDRQLFHQGFHDHEPPSGGLHLLCQTGPIPGHPTAFIPYGDGNNLIIRRHIDRNNLVGIVPVSMFTGVDHEFRDHQADILETGPIHGEVTVDLLDDSDGVVADGGNFAGNGTGIPIKHESLLSTPGSMSRRRVYRSIPKFALSLQFMYNLFIPQEIDR